MYIHLRNLLPTFFWGIQNKVAGKTAGVGSSRYTCAMASPAAGLEAKGRNKKNISTRNHNIYNGPWGGCK